ncbi:MAG: 4Fe-4S dicluster domain-containing protein [Eggerthellaceae bacterium]|nr:4Fe-4S dicluster domain-containing protein [Eggerthellaceae bacterium]
MSHYTLVIDLDRCIGCHACEIACKNENEVALGEYWNKVIQVGPHGTFPALEQYWLPVQCQQCENAPCTEVCPTGASYRDETTNIVLVDKEKCIGCKYCMMACPYGVRTWNSSEKAVEKCTLCGQLTSVGQDPACVAACCGSARFYGDLDDPTSDASVAIANAGADSVYTLTDVGNTPTTHYILSEKIASWIPVDQLEPASDAVDAAWFKKEA